MLKSVQPWVENLIVGLLNADIAKIKQYFYVQFIN